LHDLQLLIISTLESAGVMENITVTARKAQFMLDVMLATLYARNLHNQPSPRNISLLYLLARIELLNLVR